MDYETVTVDRDGTDGRVGIITLDRPEKLNAMNGAMRREIIAACDELANDDGVRTVILTGAGRGFCSGADLTSGDPPREGVAPQLDRLDELGTDGKVAAALYSLDKPMIAAVNGVAVGAGLSMELACDMRIGSEHARVKTMFVERSQSPVAGMTYFLPRIVGYGRAAELILSSRMLGADEAREVGIFDRVVAGDELIDAAIELADQIATWPPLALRASKRVLQHNEHAEFLDALKYERTGADFARRAPKDSEESRASFLEGRPPTFTGE